MRLSGLTIANFKGIGEQGIHIDLAPITMLFGPNNAGKSTVIQALHLAKEAFCQTYPDFNKIEPLGHGLDLGSFQDYVHRHDLNRVIRIGLEWEEDGLPACGDDLQNQQLESWAEIDKMLNSISTFVVEFSIRYRGGAELSDFTIYFNGQKFAILELPTPSLAQPAALAFCSATPFMSKDSLDRLKAMFPFLSPENPSPDLTLANRSETDHLDAFNEELRKSIPDLLWPFAQQTAQALGAPVGLFALEIQQIVTFGWYATSMPRWNQLLDLKPTTIDLEETDNYRLQNFRVLISSLLLSPVRQLQELLNESIYIGPLRRIPERGPVRPRKYSASNWADGSAAWELSLDAPEDYLNRLNQRLNSHGFLETGYSLYRKKMIFSEQTGQLAKTLNEAIIEEELSDEALPIIREFLNQTPETRLYLRNKLTGVELEPHDLGTGITQVFPIVAATVFTGYGALIAMEQPALHIHPKLQVALGDVFIEAINPDNPNTPMFLLETHSEHLLLRLLRRIRETYEGAISESLSLSPGDLAVNWIGQENGETFVRRLTLDEDGSFNVPWPEGFFDERGEELFG
ncbi:hypothetical protein FACS189460_0440 [Deltaproteobacteria bacterium]|nr:hypothetical protein FACS189460_0440 [Deltaproteobacteria bacterium]